MFKQITISKLRETRVLNTKIIDIFSTLNELGFKFNLERGPWVAGGILTKLVSNTPLENSDIDIFLGKDYGQEKPLYDILKRNGFTQKRTSRHALTWSNGIYTIQTILENRYTDCYSLMGDFDFTIVKLVSDGENIIYHEDALQDIDNKLLKIDEIRPPTTNIALRSIKYMNRGYVPDFLTLIFIINNAKSKFEEIY